MGEAYQGCGKGNQPKYEWSPGKDVTKRTDEQQTAAIAGLHQRGYRRGLFKGDIKSLCHLV